MVKIVGAADTANKKDCLDDFKQTSSFNNLYKVIKKVENLPEGKEFK